MNLPDWALTKLQALENEVARLRARVDPPHHTGADEFRHLALAKVLESDGGVLGPPSTFTYKVKVFGSGQEINKCPVLAHHRPVEAKVIPFPGAAGDDFVVVLLDMFYDPPRIITAEPWEGGGAAVKPWHVYQYTPDPEDPQPTDPITVRVFSGTVNNRHPHDNGGDGYSDDTQSGVKDLILEADTLDQIIWWESDIDTSSGAQTALTIKFGVGGWGGYPDQPDPAAPDEYANKFYKTIGIFSTIVISDKNVLLPLGGEQESNQHYWLKPMVTKQICADGSLQDTFELVLWPVTA